MVFNFWLHVRIIHIALKIYLYPCFIYQNSTISPWGWNTEMSVFFLNSPKWFQYAIRVAVQGTNFSLVSGLKCRNTAIKMTFKDIAPKRTKWKLKSHLSDFFLLKTNLKSKEKKHNILIFRRYNQAGETTQCNYENIPLE